MNVGYILILLILIFLLFYLLFKGCHSSINFQGGKEMTMRYSKFKNSFKPMQNPASNYAIDYSQLKNSFKPVGLSTNKFPTKMTYSRFQNKFIPVNNGNSTKSPIAYSHFTFRPNTIKNNKYDISYDSLSHKYKPQFQENLTPLSYSDYTLNTPSHINDDSIAFLFETPSSSDSSSSSSSDSSSSDSSSSDSSSSSSSSDSSSDSSSSSSYSSDSTNTLTDNDFMVFARSATRKANPMAGGEWTVNDNYQLGIEPYGSTFNMKPSPVQLYIGKEDIAPKTFVATNIPTNDYTVDNVLKTYKEMWGEASDQGYYNYIERYEEMCTNKDLTEYEDPKMFIELMIEVAALNVKDSYGYIVNVLPSVPLLIVSDIHGDIISLFIVLRKYIAILRQNPQTVLVFLGDYVDRGLASIDVLIIICLIKRSFPNRVFLCRGNHEVADVDIFPNDKYTNVICDLIARYTTKATDAVVAYVAFIVSLPLIILTDDVLCVHGGMSYTCLPTNNNNKLLDEVKLEFIPTITYMNYAYGCLLWTSYPDNTREFGNCPQFTPKEMNTFMKENYLKIFVKGHDHKMAGLQLHNDIKDLYVVVSSVRTVKNTIKIGSTMYYEEDEKNDTTKLSNPDKNVGIKDAPIILYIDPIAKEQKTIRVYDESLRISDMTNIENNTMGTICKDVNSYYSFYKLDPFIYRWNSMNHAWNENVKYIIPETLQDFEVNITDDAPEWFYEKDKTVTSCNTLQDLFNALNILENKTESVPNPI